MTTPVDQEMGTERVSTGISGLDAILHGGFLPERTYMVRGKPGTGKSITGLHYLTTGAAAGEETLYINLEEAEEDIRRNAASLGFDLAGVHFLDLSPDSELFVDERTYDIFTPDEVAESSFTAEIVERVEQVNPDRVFVDPLTQLRYLTPDEYQFRKQVLAFVRFLQEQGATVLFTSQDTSMAPDDDLQFLSDGTVHLVQSNEHRRLSISKFRGSNFESGEHSFRIEHGGLRVFPSLTVDPQRSATDVSSESIPSGISGLDEMLKGGIERGTVTIISGSSGAGKTTTGIQFMKEAASRGERSVVYSFEEGKRTLIHRMESINVPISEMLNQKVLAVKEPEAVELSAGEFASRVRTEVEENDTAIVMIDGIDGYQLALSGETREELTRELHKLSRYLKNRGVTVILINEMKSVSGDLRLTEEGVSYLADTIIVIRYLEIAGELRKTIGVLKKRMSDFERTLREFRITEYGIMIGDPLTDLRGILTGSPDWVSSDRNRDSQE